MMRVWPRDWRLWAALAVAYGFARTSGGTLPYLLFYTLLVTGALCALWVLSAVRQVELVCEPGRRQLIRGESLPVEVWLYNEGFLPVPWLELVDESRVGHAQHPRVFRTTLGSLASLRLSYQLPSPRRGRYRPGPVELTVSDPFGFFHARRQFTSRYTVTVYPPVHRWDLALPSAQPFGRMRTRRLAFTDPSSLAGIRDFRTGDSPRHVDWKATARRQKLQVREFELSATGSLAIYLSLSSAEYPAPEVEEMAVDSAAALAASALRSGLEVRILARGHQVHYLPPARGMGQLQACLELLAGVTAGGPTPLHEVIAKDLPRLQPGASVAVITPVLGPALGQLLLGLGARGRPAAVFLVGTSPDAAAARLASEGLDVYTVDRQTRPQRLLPGGGAGRVTAL
ncbi:MAG: DUF58 domain-containing protein [Bacillota bacterium]